MSMKRIKPAHDPKKPVMGHVKRGTGKTEPSRQPARVKCKGK